MSNCLYCKKPFERRHPSQKFCGKKNGRHLCKDRYHNREQFRALVAGFEAEEDEYDELDRAYFDSVHPFSEEAFSS